MPIYDNNGTTSVEIGKLYDNNSTTSHQIASVYDNNGTTSALIYKSEEYLVGSEGNNTAQYSDSSNSYSYGSGTVWSKYTFKVTNITSFDATSWSTIHFDAQMCWYAYPNPDDSTKKVHAMGLFGLKSSNSTSNISVTSSSNLSNLGNAYLTGWQWAGSNGNEWNWDSSNGKINNGSQSSNPSARATFTLDISSLTGTQYLYFGGSVNGGGITNNMIVYNIWVD